MNDTCIQLRCLDSVNVAHEVRARLLPSEGGPDQPEDCASAARKLMEPRMSFVWC